MIRKLQLGSITSIVIGLILVCISTSVKASSNTINFQGKIVNKTTGTNVVVGSPSCVIGGGSDTCSIRVEMYTSNAGGTLLYREDFHNVQLSANNGVFSIEINSNCNSSLVNGVWTGGVVTCAAGSSGGGQNGGLDFSSSSNYLQLSFDPSGGNSYTESFSRKKLVATPVALYADRAGDTNTLGGIGAAGFVQLQPSSVQVGSGINTLIALNATGGANLLDLQVGGTSALKVLNSGIINTSNNLINTAKITGVSTTTSSIGTSTNILGVGTTAGFGVNNLVLIGGSVWSKVVSIDSISQFTIYPSQSWANGASVVGYSAAEIGDPVNIQGEYDKGYYLNGTIAGSTSYADQQIVSPGSLSLASQGTVDVSANSYVNLNGNGVIINKNLSTNTTGSWSVGKAGGTGKNGGVTGIYNGQMYVWGGRTDYTNSNIKNTMDVYNFASQTWSVGVAGGTNRVFASEVIYNGSMYIWGGYNNTSGIINTMDIYNFASQTWSVGVAGGTARTGTTVVVNNNKMYLWGGVDTANNFLNTMDIYDFTTQTWSVGIAGGGPKYLASAVSYNNKMYIWGGRVGSTPFNTMDIYDFNSQTWSNGIAGGTSRSSHSAVVYNNKMYVWGGHNGTTALNIMDIYDFANQTWGVGLAGGTARYLTPIVIYNNYIYAYGGYSGSSVLNTMDIYDFGFNDTVLQTNVGGQQQLKLDTSNVFTVTGSALGLRYINADSSQYTAPGWSVGVAGGTARYLDTTVVYNGKMYGYGGKSTTIAFSDLNTLDIYNFATQTWSVGASGGFPRYFHTAEAYNGKMYIWGGWASGPRNDMAVYDFASNTWTSGVTGGTARYCQAGTIYNGKMYEWSGSGGAGVTNTMDIYDFNSQTWSTGVAGGTIRSCPTSAVYNNKWYIWGGGANTMDIYDFNSQTWSTGVTGGSARTGNNWGVYNSKLYIWAGNNGADINTMDIYDFITNTWSVGTTGGTARVNSFGAIYNGKMYNWSGFITTSSTTLNTMDIFDFGSSKVNDVFNIGNGQGVGPGNGNLFRFDAAGRAYTSQQGGWYSNGADYAEYMKTSDTDLSAGELISLNLTARDTIQRTVKKQDKQMIGVVSTSPGFVGNISINVNNTDPTYKLVAMTGQVKVRVNTENGNIAIGDAITSSSTAGQGMKANDGDSSIGIAEETATGSGQIIVLITRDDRSISNSLASLANLNWNGLNNEITTLGKVGIGLPASYNLDTNLEVADGIRIVSSGKSFTNFGVGTIDFINNTVDVGLRLGPTGLEYKPTGSVSWQSLAGVVVDDYKVTAGVIQKVSTQAEDGGWGYIQGDGTSSNLTALVSYPKKYRAVANVIVSAAGFNNTKPASLTDCSQIDLNLGINTQSETASTFSVAINPTKIDKNYYCYSWISIGTQ